MPPNTVYVGRPTLWGNPIIKSLERKKQVRLYRLFIQRRWKELEKIGCTCWDIIALQILWKEVMARLSELRGKNLACWCPIILDKQYVPCHADVLLELANNMTSDEVRNENIRRAER
jgi:hypothetical protein